MNDLPADVYCNNPNLTIPNLARYLKKGVLALILGAGASKGLGLPEWWLLVQRCMKKARVTGRVSKGTHNDTLRKKMEVVERKIGNFENYKAMVSDSLYEGVEFSKDIVKQDLLIAFGALLMGSMRGKISKVVTFNYDDVLEWYLYLHGFITNSITELPYLSYHSDVTIYHPNGYLPKLMGERSNRLILSQLSYDKRDSEYYEPWVELFCNILRTKIAIFVGLSGDDPIFGRVLVRIKKEIEASRYTGFWLFGTKKKKDELDGLVERNVVPLCFDEYDDIPLFLRNICQEAAKP